MVRNWVLLAVCVCLGFAFGEPAQAQSTIGSSGLLSSYDRDLIRRPVKGSLRNAPREPSVKLERNVVVGTPVDVYAPSFYGKDNFGNGKYENMARMAARRNGIPVPLFLALVKQESNFKPTARSHKGAIGLAQLMPGTARALGVDPHDPKENLEGGARYLATQYRKFRSWRLALAAYNAGPHAVERYNGVPPYRETQNYVKKILGS